MISPTNQKLGLTFHRKFPLSRDRVRQVLEVAQRYGKFNLNQIREETSLGTVQVECDPRYASGAGLIDEDNGLTEFGKAVAAHDLDMNRLDTQWLMHYHFVAPHYRGPAFWLRLITYLTQSGSALRSEWLAKELGAFVQETEGRRIEEDTLQATAGIFLSTYYNADGFGALNLLKKEGDDYRVGLPEPISDAAFAYILADYWAAVWGETNSVSLNRITGDAGPAPLLLLGSGETNEILGELHAQGLVRVERGVRPYTVFRLWSRPEEMRERLYANG